MLLFSTILDIDNSLSKDAFIQLVIKWNKETPHAENVIPGIAWSGERTVRYGTDDLFLEFMEYRNKNIIAARYSKSQDDGVVWTTAYIMNFSEWKMCIQLYRSFHSEAMTVEERFSTPHFISLLAEGGYLKNDGELRTLSRPYFVQESDIGLLSRIIGGERNFRLPVVFVSKCQDNSDSVDVSLLASRLKGVAHVLVQGHVRYNFRIRTACNSQNEFFGAIGVYYPTPGMPRQRFFYRALQGSDEILLEKVVRAVINYSNSQIVDPLYTWQGVHNALLLDRWNSRGEDLVQLRREKREAENAQEKAEKALDEAQKLSNDIYDKAVQTIDEIKKQLKELTHENERLTAENNGLRTKLSGIEMLPLLVFGEEDELFPGEIKDLVLAVLDKYAHDHPDCRRAHVFSDLVSKNKYLRINAKKEADLKSKLKGYSHMTGAMRQFLEGLGFTITEDGKHYKLTYYHDPRYAVAFPKSGSDWRGGLNQVSELANKMF